MKARGSFSPMNPGESEIFAFDFTQDLAPGDSVVANPPPVWACTVAQGGVSNPLDGNPTLTGNKTMQRVTNPLAGNVYVLSAVVTTSLGNKLDLWAFLACLTVGGRTPSTPT